MAQRRPALQWTPWAEDKIWLKHRVRREVVDRIFEAEDLARVPDDEGHGVLLFQGTVDGKCYRMLVLLLDREQLLFEPVTAYRFRNGDPR